MYRVFVLDLVFLAIGCDYHSGDICVILQLEVIPVIPKNRTWPLQEEKQIYLFVKVSSPRIFTNNCFVGFAILLAWIAE